MDLSAPGIRVRWFPHKHLVLKGDLEKDDTNKPHYIIISAEVCFMSL